MANLLRSAFFTTAPSIADIEALAEEAFSGLPLEVRRPVGNVALHVEEFPEDEILVDLDLESPFELMGLYRGSPIATKETGQATDIDHIFLFRRPLLDYWCETGEDLTRLIRHVLIHEIGHHIGFSDEDMERIEAEA